MKYIPVNQLTAFLIKSNNFAGLDDISTDVSYLRDMGTTTLALLVGWFITAVGLSGYAISLHKRLDKHDNREAPSPDRWENPQIFYGGPELAKPLLVRKPPLSLIEEESVLELLGERRNPWSGLQPIEEEEPLNEFDESWTNVAVTIPRYMRIVKNLEECTKPTGDDPNRV